MLGEMVDESIDHFEHSSFRPRRLCSHFMAGCCGRGWSCTLVRTRAPSSFSSLEQTTNLPAPQIMVAHLVFGVSALSRK